MTTGNHHKVLSMNDVFWGLAAQGLSIGHMVIILPVILRFMSRAEIGIWFVFFAIWSLVQLLELGFQYVLARAFSYVYAGAQELLPSGLSSGAGTLNKDLLAQLLVASRRIYLIIAAIATAILWGGGSLYLMSVMPTGLDTATVLWSWIAYSAGAIVNFYYGYINALLQGRGDMVQSNKVIVAAKCTQVVFSVVMVAFLHGGLVGLGVASLLSTLVNRFLAFRYAFGPERTELKLPPAPWTEVRKTITILWHNASRYGVALIGAFLIARATVLVAASRIGVVETASYSLALQLLIVIQVTSNLPMFLSLPRLSHLKAINDTAGAYRIFSAALVSAIVMFVVAAAGLLLFGNPLLHLIKSSTMLPEFPLLLIMAVIFLLELDHGICANLLAAGNEVPFGGAGLVTGICIAVLGWTLAPYFGTAGLVAIVGICQLVYNNWKWPLAAAQQFHVSYLQMLRDGFHYAYDAQVKPILNRHKS